jgi:heme/copper-type cytochrome/quinol oxidase subunit 2
MVGRALLVVGALVVGGLGVSPGGRREVPSARREPRVREFTIVARRYAFTPARIDVRRGEVVRIVLTTEDIPHTLTIDRYRISKKATPGRGATIEFVADTAGTHVFYCSLTSEDGCRTMRGELVVR